MVCLIQTTIASIKKGLIWKKKKILFEGIRKLPTLVGFKGLRF